MIQQASGLPSARGLAGFSYNPSPSVLASHTTPPCGLTCNSWVKLTRLRVSSRHFLQNVDLPRQGELNNAARSAHFAAVTLGAASLLRFCLDPLLEPQCSKGPSDQFMIDRPWRSEHLSFPQVPSLQPSLLGHDPHSPPPSAYFQPPFCLPLNPCRNKINK